MRLGRFTLVLAAIALILAGLGVWFWQKNTYSTENLKLELLAPQSASMGEEITYTIRYKNNGDARLENAMLIFEYPSGSMPSQGTNGRLTQSIEDIYPGQEQNLSFKARLFGKEGELKEAKVLMQYTPKNLNAKFESNTSVTTGISQVPLNFELDLPSRTESSQGFTFDLNYFSNSEYPLSDLRIKIEYPEGFKFQSASPVPIGENEWKVGLLNKASGGRISVKGTLQGESQEVKIFRAILGSWKDGKFTVFKEAAKGIEITNLKLLISQTVNGSPSYTASPGDALHYVLSFKNVDEKSLENLFLIVNLEGRPFDLASVKAEQGKFKEGDTSIVWEAKDVSRLRFLGKGEEGKVEFWVNVKENWEVFSSQDENFTLRDKVILSDTKEEFELKVNSRLVVEQSTHYQDEVFGNAGPLPPQAGAQTTYTVIWQVKNVYNDAENVTVRATLPQEVSLTGKIFPDNAPLTLDSASREIVWKVGDVPAGTGTFDPITSIAFQVAFLPTASQKGSVAQIIGEARVQGSDVFSEQTLAGSSKPLTTNLPDDPSAQGKGIVQ
ncbi:MAG: hypothetical protein Q7S62_00175 [bacterium]|nr:hypothetical protein [bacterium]